MSPYGYYDYDEGRPGVTSTMLLGLLVLVALAVVITIPGWVALPFWGWVWFGKAIAIFWLGAVGLFIIGIMLYVVGGGTD